MYAVNLKEFSGPLDKLLELIEARHLEVTRLALADVTQDFLSYVKKLGAQAPIHEVADFLVVAARLILIKSKVLLPEFTLTEEEEQNIHELEARIQLYREFAARAAAREEGEGAASRAVLRAWGQKRALWSRPLFFSRGTAIFYPSPQVTIGRLYAVLQNALAAAEKLAAPVEELKETIISLEEKIRELFHRFREAVTHSFKQLTERHQKGEIIVMFLALLHLLKERTISVTQEDQFGDIIVHNKEGFTESHS